MWEKLQVDLKVNENGEAVWQGTPLLCPSGLKLTSKTLKNVPIKWDCIYYDIIFVIYLGIKDFD